MTSVEFVTGCFRLAWKDRWKIYLTVVDGNVDIIQHVMFIVTSELGRHVATSHSPVKKSGGTWRFQTVRTASLPAKAHIVVIGRGGTTKHIKFKISTTSKISKRRTFFEPRVRMPLRPAPMPEGNYGIEVELTTSEEFSIGDVVELIRSKTSANIENMTHDYHGARSRTDIWRLMWDASILCSIDRPECNRFELVSPIMRGSNDLGEVHRVIQVVGSIPCIKVNKSMGFHVHVDVSELSVGQLQKVCQNFVKYERAMDILMPPSRRENNYCKSNRNAVGEGISSNREMIDQLENCSSFTELANKMNPDSKYYKLNLQPLVSGRQPTIEFRQHSSSSNSLKIRNWIRFCMAFVHNSAKYGKPHGEHIDSDDELFEMMMMYVVKDRYLRHYYSERRWTFLSEHDACCEGCAAGGECQKD